MMESFGETSVTTHDGIKYNSTDLTAASFTFPNFHSFVDVCNKYLLPLIIIAGTIGNSISFIVFICSKLNRLSTSVYLAALAVADTGFLLCVCIGWLDNVGVDVFNGAGICQVVVWVTYVFSFVSVWYVVCFTTEMYLSIFHSEIGQRLCKPQKAKIVVCLLFFFACAFYMYSLWSTESHSVEGKLYCIPYTNNRNVLIGLTFADTTMTLVIPLSLLIFMNARILLLILRMYNSPVDDRASSSNDGYMDSGQAGNDQRAKYASKVQKKTTKMLVTVAMLFLFLNMPSHAIRLQSVIRSLFQPGYATSEIEYLFHQIVQLLYYINFAINFVVYNACAKSFRRAILRLPEKIICCICEEEPLPVQPARTARIIRRIEHDMMQNSRLVEIHLSEMHLSEMQSFGPGFVCKSPPCLIQNATTYAPVAETTT